MKKIECLKIGLNELKSNKLRTILTMLGIVFGVAAVIAMLSIGEGARRETIEQIELLGTNNIIIRKTDLLPENPRAKKNFSQGLTLKDAMALKEINPFIDYITPQREYVLQVIYQSKIFQNNVIGTTPGYLETYNSRLISGSFIKSFHMDSYSNVCVIGSAIKNRLFAFEDALGKSIKIGNLWFNIIGVMAPKNFTSSGDGGLKIRDFNEDIYIPFTTMTYKVNKPEDNALSNIFFRQRGTEVKVKDKISVDQLTIKIKNSGEITEAAALIKRIFERRHYSVKDYEIILPEQLLEQKQRTQKIFNIVMGAIAGISLLVGGIGIMNIMLANIMERTHEIGIRRAIGATKSDLLNQFIFEAMVISITGGIIGIIMGYLMTSLITQYAEWRTIITPVSVTLAFFVSVAVGLCFGIYPAKKAADKDPIESLRYE